MITTMRNETRISTVEAPENHPDQFISQSRRPTFPHFTLTSRGCSLRSRPQPVAGAERFTPDALARQAMDESADNDTTPAKPLGDSLHGRFADADIDPVEAVREERK